MRRSNFSDHYLYTLKCKRSCADRLSFFNNVQQNNLLSEVFNYLQFGYFSRESFSRHSVHLSHHLCILTFFVSVHMADDACKAVANYLTLLPKDDVMLKNKDYYLANGICSEDMFIPSEVCVFLFFLFVKLIVNRTNSEGCGF